MVITLLSPPPNDCHIFKFASVDCRSLRLFKDMVCRMFWAPAKNCFLPSGASLTLTLKRSHTLSLSLTLHSHTSSSRILLSRTHTRRTHTLSHPHPLSRSLIPLTPLAVSHSLTHPKRCDCHIFRAASPASLRSDSHCLHARIQCQALPSKHGDCDNSSGITCITETASCGRLVATASFSESYPAQPFKLRQFQN